MILVRIAEIKIFRHLLRLALMFFPLFQVFPVILKTTPTGILSLIQYLLFIAKRMAVGPAQNMTDITTRASSFQSCHDPLIYPEIYSCQLIYVPDLLTRFFKFSKSTDSDIRKYTHFFVFAPERSALESS
jgi:hypothetical protein